MKPVRLDWRFFSGMNTATHAADLPEEYAVEASNGDFEQRGAWRRRKGLVRSNFNHSHLSVAGLALLPMTKPNGNTTLVLHVSTYLDAQENIAPSLVEADF